MQYFTSESITNHITAIKSLSGEIMYLIIGEDKAVLIDTCVGIVGLRQFIESLTDKPITVLLSHGHIDHAMGAPEFDTVYINHDDIELYKSMCDVEGRKGYVAANIGAENASKFKKEDYVESNPELEFNKLSDSMTFDLGGISVEAYGYEGHTKGCMVFLIPDERVLILGDACNNATFLFDKICSSVSEYKSKTIEIRDKLQGKYDRVFLMHHIITASVDILEEMIDVCDTIIAGKADNIPFEFMGTKAYIAKAANERFERLDGKFANLIYNPNNVK
jgi:glyoxylase-like metal-dependent hydrolase (beta-lactamase superfamily II)